ncbi:MAG TPA: hypothetical protein VNA15_03785 [Candidatus Angelobacter sp.]|nr:hypothetical protein [Candidatus Angelobacter sp.]
MPAQLLPFTVTRPVTSQEMPKLVDPRDTKVVIVRFHPSQPEEWTYRQQ